MSFPEDSYQYDTQHLREQYQHVPQDIKAACDLGAAADLGKIKGPFSRIIYCGLGGSGIGGDVLRDYLDDLGMKLPVIVCKDYDIPSTCTADSLVIVVSYSGNTEETISAYRQAQRITQNIVAISSGGKLEEMTKINRLPHILIPKGYQPRTAAVSYLFFPTLRVLQQLGVLPDQTAEVQKVIQAIQRHDFQKIAVSISEKLVDAIPIIYSSAKYSVVSYRMKCEINENAKVHAFSHTYSEFNHNEILGYTQLHNKFHIVTFRFDDDHRRIQKRMDLIKNITSSKGVHTTEVKLSGDSFLAKVFTAFLIGDLTAYDLGLRFKIDPGPVDLIEQFKKDLGPFI